MKLLSSARYHLLLTASLVLGIGMISAFGARAFTAARGATAARSARFVVAPATTATTRPSARFLSGIDNTNEPDTSVVDICTKKIGEALGTSEVRVTGAYDDPNGSHISIEVTSSQFEGKRPMQRQQLVYKAIWDELQGPVHAGT